MNEDRSPLAEPPATRQYPHDKGGIWFFLAFLFFLGLIAYEMGYSRAMIDQAALREPVPKRAVK